MRKITAYGKTNRIPMSLSNYIYDNQNGYEGARKTLVETINAQPFDAKKIAAALNRIKNRLYTFTAVAERNGTITIEAKDAMGNTDCIEIREA